MTLLFALLWVKGKLRVKVKGLVRGKYLETVKEKAKVKGLMKGFDLVRG